MSGAFLPYGRQWLDEADVEAVTAVLRGDYLTTGPAVADFEAALAERVGAGFCVSCNSATAGLHLAALALDLKPGDTAVVPTVTFLATANAVRFTGADVVFADVDPETGLMTPETLEDAINRAPKPPKAVFPVHLNGQPCEMPAISTIARRHNIRVVEDAAHALGAVLAGGEGAAHPVGACSHSDMAVFSFHPVKTVAMGEGGAVTTSDPGLAARLSRLRSHGMVREVEQFRSPELALDSSGAPNPWYYEMHELGWNYRASDLNCALGLSQLKKLDRFLGRRCAIADAYDRLVAPLASVMRPVPRISYASSGWHLYVLLMDFSRLNRTRRSVMVELRDRYGIGTQVHYLPVHLQPYYRNLDRELRLPGAETYYERILSIPFFPAMTDADVERVAAALSGLAGEKL